MKTKHAVLAALCAIVSAGSVHAAEPPDSNRSSRSPSAAQTSPSPVTGFGSGTGMGPGGVAGSAASISGGFGSPSSSSGGASQTFGGGFSQQQFPGSSPLSSSPATDAVNGANAGGGGAKGPR